MNAQMLGSKVKALRQEKGWSQNQLRDLLVANGVSIGQSYISTIENGKADDITLSVAGGLAAAFGVPLDHLGNTAPVAQDVAKVREKLRKAQRILRDIQKIAKVEIETV